MSAPSLRASLRAVGAIGAVATAGLTYSAGYEVRAFRLRRYDVPVLPRGADPVRILQVTDLHLTPSQRRKQDWVRALDRLEPDFVLDTGDNLAHQDAVPYVLDALGPLLDRPGAFVLGSNDYWAPRPKNPLGYLQQHSEKRVLGDPLPWRDLYNGLTAGGWTDLGNARARVDVAGAALDLVGVDDPHVSRDQYDRVSAPADPSADVTIGVLHAPYRRVLDAMAADGAALIVAGHTHGGQLRVPGVGALVTNCDLPRQQARGMSTWKGAALHVSAGLGTSPYTPVRFACPPEATLLTLVPRPTPSRADHAVPARRRRRRAPSALG
jgi:predicted MPP superfamily phosphohydrolase